MPIDTVAKRLSSLDFEEVWAEALPIPDAVITDHDRAHMIWDYAGHLADGLLSITVRSRSLGLDVPGRGHVDVVKRGRTVTVKRNG